MRRSMAYAALFAVILAPSASAQRIRPGDERPELPAFEKPERAPLDAPQFPTFEPRPREPSRILPPLELPGAPDTRGLAGGRTVFIRSIRVTGNTVLSREEIDQVLAPFVGRENSFADLEALSDAVTLAYVERGYVTSGAQIPDQAINDGVLEIQAIEGTLAGVEIETNGRLRPGYVRRRLERGMDGPVNVNDLETRLQILQQDPHVLRLHAALLPSERRGESRLRIQVEERTPYRIQLDGDNYQTPAIGAEGGSADVTYNNITGFGDGLWARYTGTRGLNEVQAHYTVPLTSYDTTFGLHMKRTWSRVVEDPFEALDIENNTQTYGFTIRQPVYRSVRSRVDVFLTGEWRRSKSYLLGRGFNFSEGVSEDGVAKMTLVRSGFDWTYRTRVQAFAARSQFTWGVDLLDPTKNGGDTPDGIFFAWLGQLQWARRLPFLDIQLLSRFDIQVADSPLLGLEQFGMGGPTTVRGYRNNTLVRDNGLIGSLEARVPLFRRGEGHPLLEIGPFVDVGYSWSASGRTSSILGRSTLVALGVAASVNITDYARFEASWAEPLKDIPRVSEWNLQDAGLYFRLTVGFPRPGE